MSEDNILLTDAEINYSADDIKTLDWKEHIRRRPGMYIGKLGDGSADDDGIYVLLKEVMDNSIDEYMMGFGKQIVVDIADDQTVTVRDFGRGIPLEKLEDVASRMNTGAKYDSKAFKKSVGLNGVGIKAVNALSSRFIITATRSGQSRTIEFERGAIVADSGVIDTPDESNGTRVCFTPDPEIFRGYHYVEQHVMPLLKNYTYLNTGLAIIFNGRRYSSRNGLADLLKEKMDNEPIYPPIHLKGDDIEVVITHAEQYGEEYYSFVNGQHTTQGGTHLAAYKDAVGRTIKEFFGKDFVPADIRNGMVAAISIKVEEPVFESQTKTKLGSRDVGPDGPTVAKFVSDFLKKELDNYLHKEKETADILLNKIQTSERDRKAMATVTKAARERAKKANLNNPKLRDCQIHFNDPKADEELRNDSCIFITEGDSASGSITKIRNVKTQAVFSLRGKPLNSYGKTLKVVYENDEFNLLQAALNIEDGIDGLRYNKIIIATDADVDGMHIRLLLMTFFLQYFPDLVKKGHVYILQTPLFRVRSKKGAKRGAKKSSAEKAETYYCYTDRDRLDAIDRLKDDAEITRFKGLGEISPDEFAGFIGPDMRLDRVSVSKEDGVNSLLAYFMGKNTPERQQFIINNLVIEDDSQIS